MSKYVICLGKKLWHCQDNIQPIDVVLGIIECNAQYLEINLLEFEKTHNEDRDIDCHETFKNNELVYVEVADE